MFHLQKTNSQSEEGILFFGKKLMRKLFICQNPAEIFKRKDSAENQVSIGEIDIERMGLRVSNTRVSSSNLFLCGFTHDVKYYLLGF